MKTKYGNIKVLIVWLLGLMIFSHSVIPHDHYYVSGSEAEKSESHEHSKENNLLHCIVFNNLIVEKIVTKTDKISVIKIQTENDFLNHLHISETQFIKKTIRFPEHFSPPQEYVFSIIEPSRGSPLM